MFKTNQGIDALALAALCGNAGGDRAVQGRSELAAEPAPRSPPSGNIPALVGPSVSGLLAALYQQQQQQQQQQQALGQQAMAARQAPSSIPPQLLQAYLYSQPGIGGQALPAALAGDHFAASAPTQPQPAAACLGAAFPGLSASVEQQRQAQQLQMIAAQVLAAQQQAAVAAAQPQSIGESLFFLAT